MIKSEIFASVLSDVCDVTGISERDIMSKSKSEEIVDARHLLVSELRREGYYPSMIARRMRLTSRGVRRIISEFGDRESRSPGLRMCRARLDAGRTQRGRDAEASRT